MLETVLNIGIDTLTNTVYDIVKFVGLKFFDEKKYDTKDLFQDVQKKVKRDFPIELQKLFESSFYLKYFSSPQFLDVINAYLEYKVICNFHENELKIKKYINKSGPILAKDIVGYISDNIYILFSNSKEKYIPTKDEIFNATSYILRISEEIILKKLPANNKNMIYLLSSRMDKYNKNIINLLDSISNNINNIQNKKIFLDENIFEETKIKYHKILQEKNSDAHVYLMDKFPFEQFYVPPILRKKSFDFDRFSIYDLYKVASVEVEWNDIFKNNNIVYLTGGAGYGKSLFLKKIINDYNNLNIFQSENYIVIYGELKSFFSNSFDSSVSVIEFLKDCIRNSTLMDVSSEFIEYYLNSGRCIILLDALDEVDKVKRLSLHESLIAFFKNQNPNNKICITSRDRGFFPEKNIEEFNICPLNKIQIENYVDKIIALNKFEKGDKESFLEQSIILVEKEFLNSFLVLSLLINIYKSERELPENKLELYQKCFEYIANKREKEKRQKEFDWKLISPIMKDNTFIELATLGIPNNSNIDRAEIKECLLNVYKTKYGNEVETENAIEEFLKFCSDRTELFVPSAEDKYKFFHRSFFEYFYSLYIFFRCKDENEMLEELLKFDVDSEVFELLISMLKQKSEIKYQALIELIFKKAENNLKDNYIFFNILILVMQVVDDVIYRERFLKLIIHNKDVLLTDIDKFQNLRLLSSIYTNDKLANIKISEVYEDISLFVILNNCDKLFDIIDDYLKGNDKISYNDLIKESFFIRRRLEFRNADKDKNFFLPIYSKVKNNSQFLNELTEDKILNVYKKYSHRNYKKRTSYTLKVLDKYKSFSKKKQQKIIDFIINNIHVFR